MPSNQFHEIAVLRHHDRARRPSSIEYPPIGGFMQPDVSNRDRPYRKLRGQPTGYSGRKLGVDPNDHSARTG